MKTTLIVLAALAIAAPINRGREPNPGYVAHEWGTFTSVQGADGVQIEWNPLQTVDLPGFVYSLSNPGLAYRNYPQEFLIAMQVSKGQYEARQRMETPVIYFYSDRARTVDVAVDFPEGRITEWYPHGIFQDIRPPAERSKKALPASNALRWNALAILPRGEKSEVRKDGTSNHYYAARETDANLVRMETPDGKVETDKFIFYRGIGQFDSPLTVKLEGSNADQIVLQNTTRHALGRLFIYEVRSGQARLHELAGLEAGSTSTISWPPVQDAEPLATIWPKLSA